MVSARRLAIVVSTRPARGDLDAALALARAARAADVEVAMFFMHDAVGGLPPRRRELAVLAEQDCELVACATSAAALGLAEEEIGVLLGSQDDHAAMVHRATRVVAFT